MLWSVALVSPLCLVHALISAVREASDTQPSCSERKNLAVVITGCDSGFGRAVALHLASQGYAVFAGCLDATLQASDWPASGPTVMQLDVTSDKQVDEAASTVRAWVDEQPERRVLTVINNAGVGTGGRNFYGFHGGGAAPREPASHAFVAARPARPGRAHCSATRRDPERAQPPCALASYRPTSARLALERLLPCQI